MAPSTVHPLHQIPLNITPDGVVVGSWGSFRGFRKRLNWRHIPTSHVLAELRREPAAQMDALEADKKKCIVLLACVSNCPEEVLKIDGTSNSWAHKLDMEKATEESLERHKSRIYF